MTGKRPSETAFRVAMLRAAHQVLDFPTVLDDPLALRIAGPGVESVLRSDPRRFEPTPSSRSLRAFLALRSRVAEDELALAIRRGIRQYVILGSGLDTFPYRNPYPPDTLHVFEVDHPGTQRWKRKRLEAAGISIPETLTYAPVDFETLSLEEGLRNAGFAGDAGSFFSWLGVTMYLKQSTVFATLEFVASRPAGSGVVFDYAVSPSLLDPDDRKILEALAHRAASADEPWQTFFAPSTLQGELLAMGFRHVEDEGSGELNARYFRNRSDGLRVGGRAHIMNARV